MSDHLAASRDGRYVAVERCWIGNGEFEVIVADTKSRVHDIEAYAYAPTPRIAREVAKRSDTMRLARKCTTIKLVHCGKYVGYKFIISR